MEEEKMNARKIIVEYLEKNEYDGLTSGECSCYIGDLLFPCGGNFEECEPGDCIQDPESEDYRDFLIVPRIGDHLSTCG